MEREAKIYVAGHTGMVGSAIMRELIKQGYKNIIYRTHKELELVNQYDTNHFFETEKPEFVFLSAAKVGGIKANKEYIADFMLENLQIQNNIISASYKNNVKKLLFTASSCIYPKDANQPIKEEELLTGELEPTNEGYALAKIAGLKMCNYFNKQYGTKYITAMPANAYGINDNFDLENSHVIPALIRKFHEAKKNGLNEVIMWGTGKPLREFLYVDDLAEACIFLMNNYNEDEFINVGTSEEITMKELAELIKNIVGYIGKIKYDITKQDGMSRRILNSDKINNLGWKAKTSLYNGIKKEYEWFLENSNYLL